MGIKDLLKNISDTEIKSCSVADFKGMSVAIDASSWLENALTSIAEEMMDLDFKDHMFYADFLLYRTRNFRIAGVEPVMVFGGRRNNLKLEREEARDASFEQGKRLMESMLSTTDQGCRMKLRSEALACFQRGMRVTHEMEKCCIAALKRVGVTVIVAPFEADAQLAYLCQIGMCRAVITDDSDLIVYSAICRTPFPILFNFDGTGMVQAMSLRTLGIYHGESDSKTPSPSTNASSLDKRASVTTTSENAAVESGKVKFMSCLKQNFAGENARRLLVQMCVLAGTDYGEAVKGVDISFAQEVCIEHKDVSDDFRLLQMVRHFENKKLPVRHGYLERAMRTEALYYYHPVYDPTTKTIKHFSTPNIMPCSSGKTPPSSPLSQPPLPCDANLISPLSRNVVSSMSPLIAPSDLSKLGALDSFLTNAPQEVTLQDICEGRISHRDFELITPMLPWERPEVRALVSAHPCTPSRTALPTQSPRNKSSCWLNRSHLMKMLASISEPIASSECKASRVSFPISQTSAPPSPTVAESVSGDTPKINEEASPSDTSVDQKRPATHMQSISSSSAPSTSEISQKVKIAAEKTVFTGSSSAGSVCAFSSIAQCFSSGVGRPNSSFASEDRSYHTPPGNIVLADPCLSPSQDRAREGDVDVMTSPQHSRLACETSSSPILDGVRGRKQGNGELMSGKEGVFDESDPDSVPVAVKRKYVEAVAVPVSGKTNGKGKKQKTLMVASIKSYFAMPR